MIFSSGSLIQFKSGDLQNIISDKCNSGFNNFKKMHDWLPLDVPLMCVCVKYDKSLWQQGVGTFVVRSASIGQFMSLGSLDSTRVHKFNEPKYIIFGIFFTKAVLNRPPTKWIDQIDKTKCELKRSYFPSRQRISPAQ